MDEVGIVHIYSTHTSDARLVFPSQDTDEVVIADTNPKTWMRFWRTSLKDMFDACKAIDPNSGRAGGFLRIGRNGRAGPSELAKKYMVCGMRVIIWWVWSRHGY